MTYTILNHPETSTWHPFCFYIDLTDGSRDNPNLRSHLGLPLLAFGSSPRDRDAFLIPDPHMMAAILGASPWAHIIPYDLKGFAQGIHKHYVYDNSTPPWFAKHGKAVYRGTCNPTIDANNPYPHTRVFPRADLCEATQYAPSRHIDVGVYVQNSPCGSLENMNPFDFCKKCK